jgi:arylsulfatase A-like enzyme
MGRAETPLGRRDARQVVDLYDGCLAAVDDGIGQLLRALEQRGIAERTLVAVLADHGENLFEPGQTTLHGKWFRGGDEANRVPFLLRGPGVPTGRRVETPVSLVDLAPTLCTLARLRCPEEMDGRPLTSAFAGPLEPAPVFAESGEWLTGMADPDGLRYPPLAQLLATDDEDQGQLIVRPQYEDLMVRAKHRAVWLERWKLVYEPRDSGPRYQLFDLSVDSAQRRDLGADHPAAQRLIPTLRAWIAQDPERVLDRYDLLERRDER